MAKAKALKTGATEAQVLAQVIEGALMLGVQLDRRNTGAGVSPSGKMVRFGTPGDSDLTGVLSDGSGRRVDIETKHEHFNPNKLSGGKRAHFDRQVERMKKVNDLGGVAFWTSDSAWFVEIMRHVLDGASVVETGYGPLEVVYPNAGGKAEVKPR